MHKAKRLALIGVPKEVLELRIWADLSQMRHSYPGQAMRVYRSTVTDQDR